jgi:hypothetical protein
LKVHARSCPPSQFFRFQDIRNRIHIATSTMARLSAALALTLAATASAFAPAAQRSTSSTALSAVAVENEIGVQAPVGFFE